MINKEKITKLFTQTGHFKTEANHTTNRIIPEVTKNNRINIYIDAITLTIHNVTELNIEDNPSETGVIINYTSYELDPYEWVTQQIVIPSYSTSEVSMSLFNNDELITENMVCNHDKKCPGISLIPFEILINECMKTYHEDKQKHKQKVNELYKLIMHVFTAPSTLNDDIIIDPYSPYSYYIQVPSLHKIMRYHRYQAYMRIKMVCLDFDSCIDYYHATIALLFWEAEHGIPTILRNTGES